ncbi:MAG: deoxyguanosinetriphosphate triphosphohydrolase [Christensenellales bacterium]
MVLRDKTEALELERLSPHAALSVRSKGRLFPMEKCDIRTDFQRDRDRIIHCKAFRRLKHKTQCFLAPEGDHYRTRLTHTLEVDQIARTIARALSLNEDLTEAIAMGHDLGHTPFGHMGERILQKLSGHFAHNEQSLRVVDSLEKLNLTFEVRDGILNHKISGRPQTLEGKVVSYADRIAYINHDIDDALRAGVLQKSDIPGHLLDILGHSHGERIDCMIRDIIFSSDGKDDINMSESIGGGMDQLRSFMFEKVYTRPAVVTAEEKAGRLLSMLYDHYMKNPHEMPVEFQQVWESEGPKTAICDHIASMTDRYAVAEFGRIFIPDSMV